MNKGLLILVLCMTRTAPAWAHGDILKLPSSLQITQYKLQLFLNPDDLESRSKMALAYYRTGELQNAESNLKQVLESDAKNFDALDGMGLVMLKKNRTAEALDLFKKAQKIDDQDMMVYVHMSVAYDRLDKPIDAHANRSKAQALATSPRAKKAITDEIKLLSSQSRN